MFNLFLKCQYLPRLFIQSAFVPVIKNKSGDLSDINNYRAIALSNITSKIFETLLFDSLKTSSEFDYFQLGFKEGHSTGICTNVLKQCVDY